MDKRRWSIALLLVLGAWGVGACSAILGIRDLVDPGIDASSDSPGPALDGSADDGWVDATDDASSSDGPFPDADDAALPFDPNRANWPMPSPVDAGVGVSSFFPASYDASTPGVVVDQVTGLMWQAVSDGQPRPLSDPDASVGTAPAYCKSLTLDGHNDWRLPSRIELVSLLDYSRTAPAIDTTVFPGAQPGAFWTSTTLAGQPTKAQSVDFSTGNTFYQDLDVPPKAAQARCVRAVSPSQAAKKFRVNLDTTDDLNTKLTWEKRVGNVGVALTYAGAVSWCAGVGIGWRLPTMKELQTIVDDSSFAPAIDPVAFPSTAIAPDFWTSTIYNEPYIWTVNFKSGFAGAFTDRTSEKHFVRCVH